MYTLLAGVKDFQLYTDGRSTKVFTAVQKLHATKNPIVCNFYATEKFGRTWKMLDTS
jgi:hypothetical protein